MRRPDTNCRRLRHEPSKPLITQIEQTGGKPMTQQQFLTEVAKLAPVGGATLLAALASQGFTSKEVRSAFQIALERSAVRLDDDLKLVLPS